MARIFENENCREGEGEMEGGGAMDIGGWENQSGGDRGKMHKWGVGGGKLGVHNALLFSDSCRVGSFAFFNSKCSYYGFPRSCS